MSLKCTIKEITSLKSNLAKFYIILRFYQSFQRKSEDMTFRYFSSTDYDRSGMRVNSYYSR